LHFPVIEQSYHDFEKELKEDKSISSLISNTITRQQSYIIGNQYLPAGGAEAKRMK
jgi:hypothetical protein